MSNSLLTILFKYDLFLGGRILASSRKFRNKKNIKKIKTLAFYAREECVGEEHIKQNSKRFKHSLVADCLQFVFFLKKNKLQIHLVLRIPSTNFLLFSDFILKPKIPNTLEGILMLIHMLEKAFLLTFTYNKN